MKNNSEYMERLFTLIFTGGYGAVMVWMYVANSLGWTRGERTLIQLVTPWIQFMVLIGGVLLLFLFFFLLMNFKRAGHAHHHHGEENGEEGESAEAGHVHGPECGHDHHEHDYHHAHGHNHAPGEACCGHDHDAGWNPIRFIPLLVPLILYMMGLPTDQMIRNFERRLTERALRDRGNYDPHTAEFTPVARWLMLSALSGPDPTAASLQQNLMIGLGSGLQRAIDEIDEEGGDAPPVITDLAQIEKVMLDPGAMAEYERYRKVEIDGMFELDQTSGNVSLFRLVRLRMACCLNDARPAMITAMMKKPLPPELMQKDNKTKWVVARGRLKFLPGRDGKWQAVLRAGSIKQVPVPNNPYLN